MIDVLGLAILAALVLGVLGAWYHWLSRRREARLRATAQTYALHAIRDDLRLLALDDVVARDGPLYRLLSPVERTSPKYGSAMRRNTRGRRWRRNGQSRGILSNVATCGYIGAMISTGIRDLKNHLSRYIRRVQAGERVLVTDRGQVVAELRRPEGAGALVDVPGSQYQRLIETGVVRPARSNEDPLADWPTWKLPAGTAAALLDADRGV